MKTEDEKTRPSQPKIDKDLMTVTQFSPKMTPQYQKLPEVDKVEEMAGIQLSAYHKVAQQLAPAIEALEPTNAVATQEDIDEYAGLKKCAGCGHYLTNIEQDGERQMCAECKAHEEEHAAFPQQQELKPMAGVLGTIPSDEDDDKDGFVEGANPGVCEVCNCGIPLGKKLCKQCEEEGSQLRGLSSTAAPKDMLLRERKIKNKEFEIGIDACETQKAKMLAEGKTQADYEQWVLNFNTSFEGLAPTAANQKYYQKHWDKVASTLTPDAIEAYKHGVQFVPTAKSVYAVDQTGYYITRMEMAGETLTAVQGFADAEDEKVVLKGLIS
jgi:hypothetical protein